MSLLEPDQESLGALNAELIRHYLDRLHSTPKRVIRRYRRSLHTPLSRLRNGLICSQYLQCLNPMPGVHQHPRGARIRKVASPLLIPPFLSPALDHRMPASLPTPVGAQHRLGASSQQDYRVPRCVLA